MSAKSETTRGISLNIDRMGAGNKRGLKYDALHDLCQGFYDAMRAFALEAFL
jgi:hypothetical protein